MRPKFRAWMKSLKWMCDVINISFDSKFVDICQLGDTERHTEMSVEFDEIDLMQSTGLFDRNGKEIFEGDILEIQGIRMVVKFGNYRYIEIFKRKDHASGIVYDGLGFYVECINAADPDRISPFEPETLKESAVICNVYENAEMVREVAERSESVV